MKKLILGEEFKKLRKKRSLTLLDIANSCDLNESTIHKAESNKPVRWETLHLILHVGMEIYADTPEYRMIHNLWLRQREIMAENKAPEKGHKTAPKHEVEAVRKFRILVSGKTQNECRLILYAAQRRALKS